jgi:MoaA/NifB/PqqE/SkfB family radical SAM enzyme
LTIDEIKDTWRQAQAMGAFSSIVLGGEPLLHPRFLEIIEALEPKKNIVTFTTNAIDFTEALAKDLKRLGVYLINISINSRDAETNDRLRGFSGHLEKAFTAMRICKKNGFDVFLPIATSKPYWQETLKLIDFADKNGYGVTINLMSAMGRAEAKHTDMFDIEFWQELRKIYNSHANVRSDYDVNLSLRVGCPSGHEKVHIAPYGDVTGCSMQAPSFGNVREEPLAKIVARMRKFHHYAKKSEHCLIAVDKEYIESYMDYAINEASVPYPIKNNPAYVHDMTHHSNVYK